MYVDVSFGVDGEMLMQKHLQSRNTSKIDSEFSGHPQWSWNIRQYKVSSGKTHDEASRRKKIKNMYATQMLLQKDAMKSANEDLAVILQINHHLSEEESSDKRSQHLSIDSAISLK